MIHPLHGSPPTTDAIPTHPSSSPLTSGISSAIIYELHLSRPLPTIDCSRSVKLALLREPWLTRFDQFQRVMKQPLRVGFAVGLTTICCTPFFGEQISSYLAVVGAALVAVPLMASYMLLRFEMIVLLASTFEFWYYTAVSLSTTVFLCVNYGDLRCTAIFCELLMYEVALMTDANVRGVNSTITASLIGAVALLGFVTMQKLELMTDYSSVVIANYSTWSLESSDLIANGFLNLVMILIRNAYRKWTTVVKRNRQNIRVCCISYRTPLRYTEVLPGPDRTSSCSASIIPAIMQAVPVSLASFDSPAMSQLKLSPLGFQIHADAFIQRRLVLPTTLTPFAQRLWTAIGAVGVATTVLAIAMDVGRHQHRHHEDIVLAFLSFGTSAAYVVRCVVFFNRRLFHHMLWSFDFLFLSLQSHVAYVVLCFLLRWNVAKCLVLWASWWWMHWVITLDLLTPVVRKRLGMESCLAMAVLLLHAVGHIVLAVELLFVRKWAIDDRPLFTTNVAGKTVVIYAMPVLITRMATTFCWCLRLLWRLWTQSENELILIQGAVEYEDYDRLRRLRGASRRMSADAKRDGSLFLALPAPARLASFPKA